MVFGFEFLFFRSYKLKDAKALWTMIIDLFIVSDYGNGLISNKTAKLIIKKSKFVAVNTQLNSSNLGFHVISKYIGANLITINETEMRHELRNKIEFYD